MEIMGLEVEKKELKLSKLLKNMVLLKKNSRVPIKNFSSAIKQPQIVQKGSSSKTILAKSPLRTLKDMNDYLQEENLILNQKLKEMEDKFNKAYQNNDYNQIINGADT
jgi:predicted DNA-binding transcriptional regulator